MLSSAALDQELQGRLGWAYTFVRDDALPWAVAGLLLVLCWKLLRAVYSMVLGPAPRKVDLSDAIAAMDASRKGGAQFNFDEWKAENPNPNSCLEIPCWDPSTLESLPSVKAMQPDEVR